MSTNNVCEKYPDKSLKELLVPKGHKENAVPA